MNPTALHAPIPQWETCGRRDKERRDHRRASLTEFSQPY
jgi:hypothetical protein